MAHQHMKGHLCKDSLKEGVKYRLFEETSLSKQILSETPYFPVSLASKQVTEVRKFNGYSQCAVISHANENVLGQKLSN